MLQLYSQFGRQFGYSLFLEVEIYLSLNLPHQLEVVLHSSFHRLAHFLQIKEVVEGLDVRLVEHSP